MSTPTAAVYDPNDADARFKIRSGQTDPAVGQKYRSSNSGLYEQTKDPYRDVNQVIEPPEEERFTGFDQSIRRRNDMIDQGERDQNEFAIQAAWTQQKQAQETQFAAYYQQARNMGGTPYYNQGNGGTYINAVDTSETGEIRSRIVNSAISMVSNKNLQYAWGGGGAKGPGYGILGTYDGRGQFGFDCSGLVQYAYAQAGINIGRHSTAQTTYGRVVPINSLKPGDLVGWGNSPSTSTHVAIYIGNGRIAEAANPNDDLRIRSLSGSGFDSRAFGISVSIGG